MNREKLLHALKSLRNGVDPATGERCSAELLLANELIREALRDALKLLSVEGGGGESRGGKGGWSEAEDLKLRELHGSYVPPEKIAGILGRSASAVSRRMQLLGLE